MTPEIPSPLTGQPILLSESNIVLGEMMAICLTEKHTGQISTFEQIPKNLSQIMKEQNIDLAIVHSSGLQDEQPVFEAFHDGKTIVVLERNVPCTTDEIDMYERFQQQGVPTIKKENAESLDKAFSLLTDLFVRQTNKMNSNTT